MKKNVYSSIRRVHCKCLMVIALAIALLGYVDHANAQECYISPYPSGANFTAAGSAESVQITLVGECTLTIVSYPSWIFSVQNNGSYILIQAAQNTGAIRSGSVWLDYGGNNYYVGVTQEGVPIPAITSHPSNQNKCENETATFSVTASYASSFQWYQSFNGGSYTIVDGATSSTYTFGVNAAMNNTRYRCVVSNVSGSITSNDALLTVNPATQVGDPLDQSVCSNATSATFNVGAAGGDLNFLWYRSINGGAFVPLSAEPGFSGIDGPALTVNDVNGNAGAQFKCYVYGSCPGGGLSNSATLYVNSPTLSVSNPQNQFICPGGEATFSVNSSNGLTFQWEEKTTASSQFTSIAGATLDTYSFTSTPDKEGAEYRCVVTGTCGSGVISTSAFLEFYDRPIAYANNDAVCSGEMTSINISSNVPGTVYSWTVAHDNVTGPASSGTGSTISQVLSVIANAPGNSTYSITPTSPAGCVGAIAIAEAGVYPPPVNPVIPAIQSCDFEILTLAGTPSEDIVDFKWYNSAGTLLGQGIKHEVAVFPSGSYSYQFEAISKYGCSSGSLSPLTVNVVSSCDDEMNWIETINYTGNADNSSNPGNPGGDPDNPTSASGIVSHAKTYFDLTGKALQTQVKNLTKNEILSSSSVEDQYGRVALNTLSAPTGNTEFLYKHWFATDNAGHLYDHTVLGNPLSTAPGTVGWYYSNSNTKEEHVPVTEHPYSRIEFYEDGTGEVKKTAGPGDVLRLGMGHEVLSGSFPVFGELNDYLSKRTVAIPGIVQDGSLFNEGVQSVVRDENGKYAIAISDKSGNAVMSARKGTPSDNVLEISNTITSSSDPTNAQYRPVTYFYILDDQPVTISAGTNYVIEDIETGTPYSPSGGNWKAGFYRIILSGGSVELTYSNYFLDVSYQFYDDAGRLRASLSPNGYVQLKNNGGVMYDVASPNSASDPKPVVDLTWYNYNHQGWLLSMKEPDAGETRYVYRKDGKIRFSQNAEQRNHNRFSYTHYDQLARPVESGEYKGTLLAFTPMTDPSFTQSGMKSELEKVYDQVTWDASDRKDWVKTYYDYAVSSGDLPSGFTQEFVRGTVSSTENTNIRTWYSYDEMGRVVWMAQKPKALNRTFVTEYTYDFLGNVLTVKNAGYQANAAFDQFYHHYAYDADQRLSTASTSTDGTTKKLRATYEYYLHGPLKRIELGEQLQGIDFVYNINGWLTQINHPDHASDPGNDGNQGSTVRPDVFGMVLDYYESSVSNLYSANTRHPGKDPGLIHGLPSIQNGQLLASHQPLIRFRSIYDFETGHGEATGFKEYSAENPRYKKMLSSDSQNSGTDK